MPRICDRCVHLVECAPKVGRLTDLMAELRREGFRPQVFVNHVECYTPASRYRCLRTSYTQVQEQV